MNKFQKIAALSLCLLLLGTFIVGAASTPYVTYTYSIDRDTLVSPAAYVPDRTIDNYDMNMDTPLKDPKDIFVSEDMKNIYIADSGNNRIVVCDENCTFLFEIKNFVNEHGVPDTFSGCEGVFVKAGFIYVCDTNNARIVVFDLEGNFHHTIYAPEADVMGNDTLFRPVSLAVDDSGRMYIVSRSTYSGVIAINDDGTFQGFVGVQKTAVPLSVRIRRMFFPNTVSETYNSVEFNNITIDTYGFIWVTTLGTTATSKQDDTTLENAIWGGDAKYATVKRLNAQGDDIMMRNGFFMPVGEINFTSNAISTTSSSVKGPSSLVDVALGPNGSWSTIDYKRSRIYTYDSQGQLLYAFGDVGKQVGNLSKPTAITYFGSYIYALDDTTHITVYKRTEYGDAIDLALQHNNKRQYDLALSDWKEILKRNNNFDAAYVGIGDNLFLQTQYKEASDYYKAASDVNGCSKCFKETRKQWIEDYFLVLILIIVAVIVGLSFFFKFVGKKNKEGATKAGKRSFIEEIVYGFHLIAHPFDGFWDLKHEKRGSVRGAMFHIAFAVIAVIYKGVGTSYIFNPYKYASNIFYQIATVAIPVLLWCVANWCITTLFDGEGSFKDIFIATSYSLIPISIIMIISTIMTNFMSLDEQQLVTLLDAIAFVWTGGLIFFGTMTTHGYSMGKNILATFGTILGIVFIMFIVLLFSNLVKQMISFVGNIITEASYRAQ